MHPRSIIHFSQVDDACNYNSSSEPIGMFAPRGKSAVTSYMISSTAGCRAFRLDTCFNILQLQEICTFHQFACTLLYEHNIATNLFKMSFLTSRTHRILSSLQPLSRQAPLRASSISSRSFHLTSTRSASDPILNSENISKITDAEKKITGSDEPVKGGPTVQAQSHVGETINSQTLHDITEGEKKITGGERVKGGPTSKAQSILGQKRNNSSGANDTNNNTSSSAPATGKLGSDTISKITDAEKRITGSEDPVTDGPTAQAQKHADGPIDSASLRDITEAEKKITGKDGPVKGGPTAAAMSISQKGS